MSIRYSPLVPPASRVNKRRHSVRRRAPDALPVDRRGLRRVTNQRVRVDRTANPGGDAPPAHPRDRFLNQRQIALGVDKAMFCGANHQIASRILHASSGVISRFGAIFMRAGNTALAKNTSLSTEKITGPLKDSRNLRSASSGAFCCWHG